MSENNEVNAFNLSDEDFLKQGIPDFDAIPVVEEGTTEPANQEPAKEPLQDIQPTDGDNPGDSSLAGSQEPTEGDTEPAPTATGEEVDYKTFYETLTKPIKAAGREITIKNPEDIIRMVQMGADYTRKMQDLKPDRATIRMLKENGISKEDLEQLIDIKKGNKVALAKWLKEYDVDTYSVEDDVLEQ